mmetsp:Transcript_35499/g.86054  ORF Transcript_35499/g.86054 Transcript_35499/m.86054 type:complete len:488 (+) Transcript_35499:132-1595(+)
MSRQSHLPRSSRLTATQILLSGLLFSSSASAFTPTQRQSNLGIISRDTERICTSYSSGGHTPWISTSSTTSALSSTAAASDYVSIDRTAPREIDYFQGWAGSCGVQPENGFFLQGQLVDDNEDYYAATSSGAATGSRMLYVPGEMILSAYQTAQEYNGYVDASLQTLAEMNMQHLHKHFHLFLKVLVEYEKGSESPYMPWLNAMPRKWNTAVSMDNFCLSVLPPYIKAVCQTERDQLGAFKRALGAFDYLSPETNNNSDLLKFAYNVVFTRSWRSDEGDYRIVPVADMMNHEYPDNCVVCYDQNGGCEVYAKEDIPAGGALTLSCGAPTNPSKLLATHGFLHEPPATFCKIVVSNPSDELVAIGYDPNRMVFFTGDGSIAQVVWDVLLYHRLERKPDLAHVRDAFYQAHMSGDEETKNSIHNQFQRETVGALLRHVNHVLAEVAELTVKCNRFDSSQHPRLPLLLKHHGMVTTTFTKVRDFLMDLQG